MVANEGHDIAGLHGLARGDGAERATGEMAVKHPERHAIGIVFKDDCRAVVVRVVVVDHGDNTPVEHCLHGRVRGHEDVDAVVIRACVGAVGDELFARVHVAVLQVAAEGKGSALGGESAFEPGPVRLRIAAAFHAGSTLVQLHPESPRSLQVDTKDRLWLTSGRPEPGDDGVVVGDGRKAR